MSNFVFFGVNNLIAYCSLLSRSNPRYTLYILYSLYCDDVPFPYSLINAYLSTIENWGYPIIFCSVTLYSQFRRYLPLLSLIFTIILQYIHLHLYMCIVLNVLDIYIYIYYS